MLLSCLSNRPVGFIACLCAVFSAQVHGNRTGMTRPGHRSLQNANAEQNKRRYSARFLYNSTPSFSAPEASTAGTMAGPPPDLISTWHDLSIKRAFYHWPHAGLSFCWRQIEDHMSRLGGETMIPIHPNLISERDAMKSFQVYISRPAPMRNIFWLIL